MEKTLEKIQENLRDATNEAESLMWLEIGQLPTRVFSDKNEQIKELNKLAQLITLFTSSRTALTKTHNVL